MANEGTPFTKWRPQPHLVRWYFDDESYLEATRRNIIHRFRIRPHGNLATQILSDREAMEAHHPKLVASVLASTDVDITT